MDEFLWALINFLFSMATHKISFTRRRSSSLSSLSTATGSDDETYWSASSSRKVSTEDEIKKKFSLSTVQSAENLEAFQFVSTFAKKMKLESELSNETLVNREQSHSARRSSKPDLSYLANRRGSASLPGFLEGMNSGKLVSRLSLVGDEMDETLRAFRESTQATRRRWTIFDTSSNRS